MPTLKTRINVTLPKDIEAMLKKLAKRDDVPQSTKALELIKMALEIEEDELWDTLAAKRDTPRATFLSHDEAWS